MTKRLAIVEKEKCHPGNCGDWLCIRLCPVNRAGEECITKGDDGKAKISEELCTGCGICPKRCPFGAIHIINLPEELEQQPIHRYGKNAFELFNLPTPIFGKVVGLLGINGIGKSTAIKVLAGVLKPNLGKEKPASYDELIEFFKGTEAQLFFEKIKAGEINVSYKPQQVDLIPKTKKGKVKDLLKKVDESNQLKEIAEKLDITNILDNDVSKISGGELQRVAIAATVLKKANLYIFDEPTSYLDVKQRIKISRFIKSLADKDTAVLVVEHDLIILDYMTDLVHIMYGKESCYGVVAQPRSTRTAINTYLSGYLKEENMRFRDHPIKFASHPVIKKRSQESILTSWENIKKKLGKFQLTAESGEIEKKIVTGIMGENGIGKTSFVKILAREISPDQGKIKDKVKVSYKPQYLKAESDEIVMNVLQDAIKKHTNDVINPLNIKPLYTKKLNELSGGELQRVSIALCLSKEADLYLLDEPSAYLDVEQRLIVSRTIKDIIEKRGTSSLIVDHDLLFLDYISDKLLIFDGLPAAKGEAKGPFSMEKGMNHFLKDLEITFRRDPETNRPRANKENSVKDREQKTKGKYYYS
ncbi:ribosome biogenesis/translation initiation ATPase RLI [Candidatus Woesearchaeota archaeon]|nr:ribosome biogenesis/translation initiation ATPase RLI [Candidatus Woesearchaeota archaeon]